MLLKLLLLRNYWQCKYTVISSNSEICNLIRITKTIMIINAERKKRSRYIPIYLVATRSTNLFYSTQIMRILPMSTQSGVTQVEENRKISFPCFLIEKCFANGICCGREKKRNKNWYSWNKPNLHYNNKYKHFQCFW